MQIPFVGGAYALRSRGLDAQRSINLFPVVDQSGGAQSVAAMYGTPGLRLLATLPGAGGIRAMHPPSMGDPIVVQGSSVYRVNAAWGATHVGTLGTATGPVSIADNGKSAVIVDGTSGYSLNLGDNTFAQIHDEAFYGADTVAYLDGYFIFNRPRTSQFYLSGLFDVTFNALDFASVEGTADPIVRHVVDHREVWFFKRNNIEVWVNSGDADFPLTRTPTSIQVGCSALGSVARMDNSMIWLGADDTGSLAIFRAQGYQPARISTEAIDYAIAQYDTVSDAIAYGYEHEGHTFYQLTFPTANATWVFDAATGQWHERLWRDPADGSLNRHRSNCHMAFRGAHVVGDWENGNLYALDMDCYTDNGAPLPRIRVTGYIGNPDSHQMQFDSVQIDLEAGVGLQAGQGSAPVAILEWSDKAKVWSNQHARPIGAVGNYNARSIWRRLGRSRSRVFRLTISDPVKVVVLGGSAQVRMGSS
jgi:hypothetical protein